MGRMCGALSLSLFNESRRHIDGLHSRVFHFQTEDDVRKSSLPIRRDTILGRYFHHIHTSTVFFSMILLSIQVSMRMMSPK